MCEMEEQRERSLWFLYRGHVSLTRPPRGCPLCPPGTSLDPVVVVEVSYPPPCPFPLFSRVLLLGPEPRGRWKEGRTTGGSPEVKGMSQTRVPPILDFFHILDPSQRTPLPSPSVEVSRRTVPTPNSSKTTVPRTVASTSSIVKEG